jgi:hypothetical protein
MFGWLKRRLIGEKAWQERRRLVASIPHKDLSPNACAHYDAICTQCQTAECLGDVGVVSEAFAEKHGEHKDGVQIDARRARISTEAALLPLKGW